VAAGTRQRHRVRDRYRIANTIAECWTMARYLMREKLEELGLHHFDPWAKLFADDLVSFRCKTGSR
jgi:N12 class adenine-specific DNA methylase